MSENHWVYGLHAVKAILSRNPQQVERLYVQQRRGSDSVGALMAEADARAIPSETVSRQELDELVGGVHQGVAAQLKPLQMLKESDLYRMIPDLPEPALLLVLDGITDPHNLGACLRSADAAGVHAVIAPKDKSASINATVRKVACGAAEVVPFIPVTNLARALRELQQLGVWIIGTAGEAEQSLYAADMTVPTALVMGSEGKGLRRLTREHCDHLVHLPLRGTVSSINVSVATGVCLFEAIRQREGAK